MLETIFKYPFSFIFTVCLLLFLAAGTFFGSAYISIFEASFLIISIICAFIPESAFQRFYVFLLSLFCCLIYLVFELSPLYLLISELVILSSCCYLHSQKNQAILFFILAASFCCHLFYIQSISINQYQHDLNGILLYMDKISQDGFNWKNFNPWSMYYLFHQPLHFWIQAYIFDFSVALWNSVSLAQETLQYLSLFFVTATTLVMAAILKELKLSSSLYLLALLLLGFNPTLFLFSGYISDDTPVLFWGCCVIYFSLKWFNQEKTSYIVACALCFALGVLTKLSLLMLVPALSFMFIYKLYRKQFARSIWLDLNLFIIITVPLALSWIVRNHILFDMQFYNVPDTSPNGQNFYYLTFSERILDFSQLLSPFIQAPTIVDANMWLALIKTELFGEWNLALTHTFLLYPALVLYLFNLLIKIAVLISCGFVIYTSFNGKFSALPFSAFFIILYFTLWGYSFKYAMDYPFACSSDFRLFALLMLPETILLTSALDKIPYFSQQKKANFLLAFAVMYAVLSSFIYTCGL